MSFERPWMMLAALAPLLWLALRWRSTPHRLAFTLKALALAAILAAVAEPSATLESSRTAVAVLADTSLSVSDADLSRETQLVSEIERARGRNWLRVLPFARSPRAMLPRERSGFEHSPGEAGTATGLEAAVRDAMAVLPPGLIPRVALISDGNENSGSVARAAWQARQLGVAIDAFPLAGRPRPELSIASVSLPSNAFSGERFPVDLTVTSPRAAAAVVEMSADGKRIGEQPVDLESGANRLRVHASVASSGAVGLSGVVRAAALGAGGEARFGQAIALRRPRALFVSQDPPGSESHLFQTLAAAQFDVTEASETPADGLSGYQIVVLNNVDLNAIPESRKEAIEDFVKQGGGLLAIGGEREIYAEKKSEDPLDRVLPAKIAPPRSPEGTCVVIIIDKSSSMEGKKIELARLAAIGVIDNLRPSDKVGVLIFDNSFQWAVPVRRAEDRVFIDRLVAGITPDGGTQIAPALSEAYHKILPEKAVYKHIVLLTDGISEEGDSLDLSKEALAQHVTISTVGLGQDVNRSYLEKVASAAGGKSYFLSDPSGLQQILLRDVMEHTGSTAIEKELKPVVEAKAEILDGVGMETAPALHGYVKFKAKPDAETILSVDERDPLLVRWQNGLGRAAIFTSDAKSRWAAAWVTWPGFDRFWANVFHDLLPHAASEEARAEYDPATGDLVVEYRLAHSAAPPALYVFGPAGFQRPLPVALAAPDLYRGRIAIGARQGLFRIRPLEDSREFPEVGFYREEQERLDYGTNTALLRGVAEFTGGRFNPAPSQVFDAEGRSLPTTIRFWPGLLVLALLLNLAEVFLRKGPGVLAWLRRSDPVQAQTASS